MCRSVEDAVRVLQVIAGYDSKDPITEHCKGKNPENYISYLDPNGVTGKRIGVFRYYTDMPTADERVKEVFEKAIIDLSDIGATIVDPAVVPDFVKLRKGIWRGSFKVDLENYLESLGEDAPYKTLQQIYDSGLYLESLEPRLKKSIESEPVENLKDIYEDSKNIAFRDAIVDMMDENNLDAIIYPTWNNPPRLHDDKETPAGDNSQLIPPNSGMPGFSVPMGYSYDDLPCGLQIVGRLFSEPTLIQIAYSYEQATRHRKPPVLFP